MANMEAGPVRNMLAGARIAMTRLFVALLLAPALLGGGLVRAGGGALSPAGWWGDGCGVGSMVLPLVGAARCRAAVGYNL